MTSIIVYHEWAVWNKHPLASILAPLGRAVRGIFALFRSFSQYINVVKKLTEAFYKQPLAKITEFCVTLLVLLAYFCVTKKSTEMLLPVSAFHCWFFPLHARALENKLASDDMIYIFPFYFRRRTPFSLFFLFI